MPRQDIPKIQGLVLAVLIDLIGYFTYAIPVLGEFGDLIWAPISAYLIFKLFRSKTAASIGFIEEILPGTDFIPTATLTWALLYFGLLKPKDDNFISS